MPLSKKAQELPLRTIILFIIALVVFSVVILIFLKYSNQIFGEISEIIQAVLSIGPEK